MLYYDIETVPLENIEALVDEMTFKAPSNYTNKEAIDKNITSQKEKAREKAALHWTTGRIVAISLVDDLGVSHVFFDVDERKILFDFFSVLVRQYPIETLCGKSSESFDFGFIVGRALVADIGLPRHFMQSKTITDVDQIFGYRSTQTAKLSAYAQALRLSKYLGLDGSSVREMWDNIIMGDESEAWETKLRAYCLQDSFIVREMMRRYRTPFVDDSPVIEKAVPF